MAGTGGGQIRRPWVVTVLLCGVIAALAWGPRAAAADAEGTPPRLVREAQRALSRAGHDPGAADGVVGPRTRAALAGYQRAEGLPPTGRLDPETIARLGIARRALEGTPQHVRAAQEALRDMGHDPGPIDGIMGRRTKAALRRYATVPSPTAPDPRRAAVDQLMQGRLQSP